MLLRLLQEANGERPLGSGDWPGVVGSLGGFWMLVVWERSYVFDCSTCHRIRVSPVEGPEPKDLRIQNFFVYLNGSHLLCRLNIGRWLSMGPEWLCHLGSSILSSVSF